MVIDVPDLPVLDKINYNCHYIHMKRICITSAIIALALISLTNINCCGKGKCRTDNNDTHTRAAINAELEIPFDMQFSQMASVIGEDLFVEFIDVTEDSRCPVNALCVWEGQAIVLLGFYKDENTHAEYSVTSRAGHPQLGETVFDGYKITLLEVLPERVADQEIEKSEYKVKLTIEKL